MRKSIRFGIIGGGLMGREIASAIARWCHLLDVDARPTLVAVCDQVPAQLEWFKEHFASVRQTCTDYRDLLANDAVDAVYCAVPHHLHQELYLAILAAGKHMLGEKPFGIDRAANAAIMQAIARHPKQVVRCSSEFPFFPAVQRIVRDLTAGRFGQIIEVECGFLHSSDLDRSKPINWKRLIAYNGEYGCMGDLGLHVFHVPLRMGWRPRNVRAILSNIVPQRPDAKTGQMVECETWDNATLLCEMQHDGGYRFPMTAKTQRISPGQTNTWYLSVLGEKCSTRFTTKRPRTLEMLQYEPGREQCWETYDLGYASAYKAITGGIFEFGFPDAILQMVAAFCDQIVHGPEAELPFGCATPAETRMTHEIFTAALASQRHSQAVAIGSA